MRDLCCDARWDIWYLDDFLKSLLNGQYRNLNIESSEMKRTVVTLSNAFQVIKETNTEIPDAILPEDDDDDDDGAIMFTPHPIGGKNKQKT
jgi:hypothetical protein